VTRWLAEQLGVPPSVAVAVAGEAAVLEAGGCPFCVARRIRVLLAGSRAPLMRKVVRDLDGLRLWAPPGRCVDCEEEAA